MPYHSDATAIIRRLRKERALTLESLAAEADITPLALSNIELRSSHPQRSNLIRLLDALDKAKHVPVEDRRAVLDSFGYTDTPGLPHATDIEKAIKAWQHPFKEAPYPAYLVDFAQRIHDWNDQALSLIGEEVAHPEDLTVFDLMFAPPTRGDLRLANEEEIVTKTVAYMWSEYRPFCNEPWYHACIAAAEAKYPLFGNLYEGLTDADFVPVDVRALEPVIFEAPGGVRLSFKIIGVDLVSDPRFRAVQYIPMDTATARILTDQQAS